MTDLLSFPGGAAAVAGRGILSSDRSSVPSGDPAFGALLLALTGAHSRADGSPSSSPVQSSTGGVGTQADIAALPFKGMGSDTLALLRRVADEIGVPRSELAAVLSHLVAEGPPTTAATPSAGTIGETFPTLSEEEVGRLVTALASLAEIVAFFHAPPLPVALPDDVPPDTGGDGDVPEAEPDTETIAGGVSGARVAGDSAAVVETKSVQQALAAAEPVSVVPSVGRGMAPVETDHQEGAQPASTGRQSTLHTAMTGEPLPEGTPASVQSQPSAPVQSHTSVLPGEKVYNDAVQPGNTTASGTAPANTSSGNDRRPPVSIELVVPELGTVHLRLQPMPDGSTRTGIVLPQMPVSGEVPGIVQKLTAAVETVVQAYEQKQVTTDTAFPVPVERQQAELYPGSDSSDTANRGEMVQNAGGPEAGSSAPSVSRTAPVGSFVDSPGNQFATAAQSSPSGVPPGGQNTADATNVAIGWRLPGTGWYTAGPQSTAGVVSAEAGRTTGDPVVGVVVTVPTETAHANKLQTALPVSAVPVDGYGQSTGGDGAAPVPFAVPQAISGSVETGSHTGNAPRITPATVVLYAPLGPRGESVNAGRGDAPSHTPHPNQPTGLPHNEHLPDHSTPTAGPVFRAEPPSAAEVPIIRIQTTTTSGSGSVLMESLLPASGLQHPVVDSQQPGEVFRKAATPESVPTSVAAPADEGERQHNVQSATPALPDAVPPETQPAERGQPVRPTVHAEQPPVVVRQDIAVQPEVMMTPDAAVHPKVVPVDMPMQNERRTAPQRNNIIAESVTGTAMAHSSPPVPDATVVVQEPVHLAPLPALPVGAPQQAGRLEVRLSNPTEMPAPPIIAESVDTQPVPGPAATIAQHAHGPDSGKDTPPVVQTATMKRTPEAGVPPEGLPRPDATSASGTEPGPDTAPVASVGTRPQVERTPDAVPVLLRGDQAGDRFFAEHTPAQVQPQEQKAGGVSTVVDHRVLSADTPLAQQQRPIAPATRTMSSHEPQSSTPTGAELPELQPDVRSRRPTSDGRTVAATTEAEPVYPHRQDAPVVQEQVRQQAGEKSRPVPAQPSVPATTAGVEAVSGQLSGAPATSPEPVASATAPFPDGPGDRTVPSSARPAAAAHPPAPSVAAERELHALSTSAAPAPVEQEVPADSGTWIEETTEHEPMTDAGQSRSVADTRTPVVEHPTPAMSPEQRSASASTEVPVRQQEATGNRDREPVIRSADPNAGQPVQTPSASSAVRERAVPPSIADGVSVSAPTVAVPEEVPPVIVPREPAVPVLPALQSAAVRPAGTSAERPLVATRTTAGRLSAARTGAGESPLFGSAGIPFASVVPAGAEQTSAGSREFADDRRSSGQASAPALVPAPEVTAPAVRAEVEATLAGREGQVDTPQVAEHVAQSEPPIAVQPETGRIVQLPLHSPRTGMPVLRSYRHITPAEMPRTVQNAVRTFPAGGGGLVHMTLAPESLGEVLVAISVKDTQTEVTIHTESADSRRVVEAQLPALREKLVQAGLQVEHIEVRQKQQDVVHQDSRSWKQGGQAQEEQRSRQEFVRSFRHLASEERRDPVPLPPLMPQYNRSRGGYFERYA